MGGGSDGEDKKLAVEPVKELPQGPTNGMELSVAGPSGEGSSSQQCDAKAGRRASRSSSSLQDNQTE